MRSRIGQRVDLQFAQYLAKLFVALQLRGHRGGGGELEASATGAITTIGLPTAILTQLFDRFATGR